jgi:alpha-tubulin suppressor-like RCC1 family protein
MPILASNFTSNSLQGTVVVSGGQANIQLPLSAFAFEGQKTFNVRLRKEGFAGIILASSNVITIPDTSSIVSFTSNISTMNETSSNVILFTITTANVPSGANIYYTTNSIVNANVNTSDFVGGNTGVITIVNNSATFTLRANADINTEGTETYNIFLRTGDVNGAVFYTANANTITVVDTSTPPVTNGSLFTWGQNIFGSLGDGTTVNKSSPVQTIAAGTNWRYVSSGTYVGAGIKTDGTLWVWGENGDGTLGTNDRTSRSSPVQTVSGGTNWQQSAHGGASAGIKTDGTLWVWGSAGFGVLGDGTTTKKSSPVQTIAGGTNWQKVSVGPYNMAAIKTDGTLWVWGYNLNGTLGNGTSGSSSYKSSPVQTSAGGTNWRDVQVSGQTMVGIKTDGTLWTWGNNTLGELGNNSNDASSTPIQTVSAGTNWASLATGVGNNSTGSIVAIKTDGTLWAWGSNNYGQLGDGTTVHKSSPVQTVAGGTNWLKITSSGFFTAGIKTDGTLWVWGWNAAGGLGVGDTTNRSSPVQIAAPAVAWLELSASSFGISAIGY